MIRGLPLVLALLALLALLAGCDGPPDAAPSTCPFSYATRAAGQLTVVTAPASGPGSCVLILPADVTLGERLPVRSDGPRTAQLSATGADGTAVATAGTLDVTALTPTLHITIDASGPVTLKSSFDVPIL